MVKKVDERKLYERIFSATSRRGFFFSHSASVIYLFEGYATVAMVYTKHCKLAIRYFSRMFSSYDEFYFRNAKQRETFK